MKPHWTLSRLSLFVLATITLSSVACSRGADICWECQFTSGTKSICGTKEEAMKQVMGTYIMATGDSTIDSNNFLKACKR